MMSKLLRNFRTFVGNAGVRNAYISWRMQRLFGKEPFALLPNGFRCFGSSKFNDFCAMSTHCQDTSNFSVFRHFLKEDGVFVDVGANMGITTLVAAGTARLSRIIAFEPTHKCAEVWHKNVCANGILNATLLQCAISDRIGTMEFVADPSAPEYNRLNIGNAVSRHQDGNRRELNVSKVSVTTLDEVCEILGVEHISLLKIDVEGAEPTVWRGAKGLLRKKAITAVFLEFVPAYFRDMNEDVAAFASDIYDLGYAAFEIDSAGCASRRLTPAQLVAGDFIGPNIVLKINLPNT